MLIFVDIFNHKCFSYATFAWLPTFPFFSWLNEPEQGKGIDPGIALIPLLI